MGRITDLKELSVTSSHANRASLSVRHRNASNEAPGISHITVTLSQAMSAIY